MVDVEKLKRELDLGYLTGEPYASMIDALTELEQLRAALRALVEALPKCEELANRNGGVKCTAAAVAKCGWFYCDEHWPSGQPGFDYAEPLRAAIRLLGRCEKESPADP